MSSTKEIICRLFLCVIGLLLSIYSYHVETVKEEDSDYEALCDISSSISCSAVFTSEYGTGFGIIGSILGKDHILNQPNSVFGVMFFLLQAAGAFWNDHLISTILYWMTAFSILACFYLAYILAFILHDFCVVCVTTYVLTFLLHYLNYRARVRCRVISKKLD